MRPYAILLQLPVPSTELIEMLKEECFGIESRVIINCGFFFVHDLVLSDFVTHPTSYETFNAIYDRFVGNHQ